MLVGGVVGDVVGDDLDAASVGLGDQAVEDPEVTEDRLDVGVVRNVEAGVEQRRGEAGADPDRADAKRAGKVVEPFGEADQVADAVAVAVAKAQQVVLVDHHAAPPLISDVGGGARGPGVGGDLAHALTALAKTRSASAL